jgi:dihydrolipoamide dehydrogenase
VQVDGHFKTNVDGVYAIGDCIPGPMLAHKAEEDGYVLAEMLAGKPGHVDYNTVPSIVYTDPEVRFKRKPCDVDVHSVLGLELG